MRLLAAWNHCSGVTPAGWPSGWLNSFSRSACTALASSPPSIASTRPRRASSAISRSWPAQAACLAFRPAAWPKLFWSKAPPLSTPLT